MARTFKDVKSWPKYLLVPQNLISDKYYDLWLSIDTKNSPLSGILLLLQAAELRLSKMKIFKQKKGKISNFELQKRYIPQKKAKNIYNSDSARKSVNFCKKKYFFSIFLIFATCSRTPWNFRRSFFWKFQKKNPKMALLGLIKHWKEQSQEFWWT